MNHAERYFLALGGRVVAAGSDCRKAMDTDCPAVDNRSPGRLVP